ncbi:MAG: hypothetical protein OXJ52_00435 [Oligoflexia bacterium]|nr:hypothetical protein [Oligoflexia bacterium]
MKTLLLNVRLIFYSISLISCQGYDFEEFFIQKTAPKQITEFADNKKIQQTHPIVKNKPQIQLAEFSQKTAEEPILVSCDCKVSDYILLTPQEAEKTPEKAVKKILKICEEHVLNGGWGTTFSLRNCKVLE